MSNAPTILFYALTAEAAAAELGIVLWNDAHRFVVVEYWVEAQQYDLSGGYATREDLVAAMSGETYSWY